MTQEETKNYITAVANMGTLYADIVSSRAFDLVDACRKAGVKHEAKRAVSIIEKKRKEIEAYISKVVEYRERFAQAAELLEDAAKREFDMLGFAVANAVGRLHGVDHATTAKAVSLYLFLMITDDSFRIANEKLKKMTGARLAVKVAPMKAAVANLIKVLLSNSDRDLDLDNEQVVRDAVVVLCRKISNKNLLENIFLSLD